MIKMVKVVAVKPMGGHRLWVQFSDGSEGIRDFADVVAEQGPMIEPLRDPKFFAKAFISFGVPSWPNGFDVDAIALHMEMEKAGLLTKSAAA